MARAAGLQEFTGDAGAAKSVTIGNLSRVKIEPGFYKLQIV